MDMHDGVLGIWISYGQVSAEAVRTSRYANSRPRRGGLRAIQAATRKMGMPLVRMSLPDRSATR